MRIAAMTVACAAAATISAAAVVARQELPEGLGRDTTVKMCSTQCHGIERIVSEHRSKSQWAETVETMKIEGAKGTDEDIKAVVNYLTMRFGVQVRINKATVAQINDALVLPAGQAEAIVKHRDANGTFADLAALLKVPGIDAKAIEDQKANILF